MEPYKDLGKSYIDGEWKEGNGNRSFDVLNPFTQKSIFPFQSASELDIDEAYTAAEEAQKEWAETPPSQKRNIFDEATRIMKERKDEIIDWITREMGGTRTKAALEWGLVLENIRVASGYPFTMNGEIYPSMIPGKESRMYREPKGVITVITPWNFAMTLSMRSVAPALATGNAVVLKPAEDTPVTGGTLIAKIFEEAGLPKGLLNVVLGKGSDIGNYLVEHPVSDLVSFTGSTPVGKGIAVRAGERMKDVSLELGGNNAFIVLDDADVDKAVDAAIFGKFMHQGQICMAINRILVDKKLVDEFTKKYVEKANAINVGDPKDPETELGPVINRSQAEKINSMIDKAIEEGAELLTERKTEGNLIHPVVLTNVTNDMEIAQNEIFGPVATIISFDGDEEAAALANDTDLGLSGAVHSGDTERALNVANHIKTGMIHINDQPVNDDANAVFGGEKQSGVGRFNGDFVKEKFTTTKWVTVQHKDREYAL
ncbi:aldehyde dehydrogenase family protein [Fodinibius sediminis]|uniref:Aldehyde dehydrogenase (NAD+) n=1 Tax=Fodinibius sediminis TaxID=1214077 RepID=A0A521EPQ4_9BACT|nr:aldehyde dehydrogenase family protein [Fodinibius sediminis]SMO85897.1 aldehyde dehydrogenase (NAD+) [Fodinibius sediminis]